jgi:hypothetical protein
MYEPSQLTTTSHIVTQFLLIALCTKFGEAWLHLSKALRYRTNKTISSAMKIWSRVLVGKTDVLC